MIILSALFYLGRDHLGKITALRQADPLWIGAMISVFLITRLFSGQILRNALATLGHHLSISEAFFLTILRAYAGLIIPRAGLGAAGIYLKVRHQVNFTRYGALVLPILFLQLGVIGPLGMAALLGQSMSAGGAIPWHILAIFAVVTAIGILALLINIRVPKRWTGRVAQGLRHMSESWSILARSRNLVVSLTFYQFLMALLRATRLYLALVALGHSPSLLGVLIASLLADLAFFVGITPNALGIREAVITFSALYLGVSPDEAFAAAVLDRIVVTLTTIVVAQIALWRLMRGRPNQEEAA